VRGGETVRSQLEVRFDGQKYTPDWRTDRGWWIELRGWPTEPDKALALRETGERVLVVRPNRRGLAEFDGGEPWACATCARVSWAEDDPCCSDRRRRRVTWPVAIRGFGEKPTWWPKVDLRAALKREEADGAWWVSEYFEDPWPSVDALIHNLRRGGASAQCWNWVEDVWLKAAGWSLHDAAAANAGNVPVDLSPFAWAADGEDDESVVR
jgi:hypothetical protein